MVLIRSLLVVSLVACVPAPATSLGTSAISIAAPTCFDPATYGGVPSDGVSDRVAIQAALDAAAVTPDGGTVCIGAGRWTVERAPAGSYNATAALATHGHRVTIAGAGPETVLELTGDQGAHGVTVLSVDPGAAGIAIRDLTIDTSAASNTDEQTHAIGTSGICSGATCAPITDLVVEHIRFVHPAATDGTRKGDCIRLLGNAPATRVDRVRIEASTFTSCARSGIEIQRNVHGLIIAGNTFALAGDTDIDSEPTGGAGDLNDTVVIQGNTFSDDPAAQGDYAITLGGIGGPMTGVTVSGNVFLGRGLRLYRTGRTIITGNAITAVMKTIAGVLDASNVCAGLVVTSNVIARAGAPGPVIRLSPHSGAMCGDALVTSNWIEQGTAGYGVYLEAASNVTVALNSLTWTVPAPSFAAIHNRATIAPVDHLQIVGNRIRGPVTYGVILSSQPNPFGADVRVEGNSASGTVFGLNCTGSGGFAPITSYGNTLGPRVCVGVTFVEGD